MLPPLAILSFMLKTALHQGQVRPYALAPVHGPLHLQTRLALQPLLQNPNHRPSQHLPSPPPLFLQIPPDLPQPHHLQTDLYLAVYAE